jgi:hypothetical protein
MDSPSHAPSIAAGAGAELAEALSTELSADGTCLVLQLDPTLGVCVAARLNAMGLARPLLVIPRWPYAEAVLDTARLTAALLREAVRLRSDAPVRNVVMVLDAERGRSIDRPAADTRADNRYTLSPHDLPSLAALRARGIRRIVKIQTA